ncbi:hypothetical protein DFJ73DRAFT_801438 [Zopfochytrium polystomum]|nr:hypothetical protein DFJ73DRAFT_801438 [Zopfochytrium polystomum]
MSLLAGLPPAFVGADGGCYYWPDIADLASLYSTSASMIIPSHIATDIAAYLNARDRYDLASLFRLESVSAYAFFALVRSAFKHASSCGSVELLNRLERCRQLRPQLYPSFEREPHQAVLEACRFGHVHVLEWWKNTGGVNWSEVNDALSYASAEGNIAVLEWWRQSEFPMRCTTTILEAASSRGHVAILQWWRESGVKLPAEAYCLDRARWVEVLQWWKESGLPVTYTALAFSRAILWGQFDRLEWWTKSGLELKYSESYIWEASRPVLLWLKENNVKLIGYGRCLVRASSCGDVETLGFWRDLTPLQHSEKPIDTAIRSGNVAALQWWKDSGLEFKYTSPVEDEDRSAKITTRTLT